MREKRGREGTEREGEGKGGEKERERNALGKLY